MLRAGIAVVLAACLGAVLEAQPRPRGGPRGFEGGPPVEGALLRIPSAAAGREGLWVRVSPPPRARYTEGAPVVVHVPGGMQAGGLGVTEARLSDWGFIDVVFLFPGGVSGPPLDGQPRRSGGVYDWRGEDSVRALADVIRFATGQLRSTEGKTIADYVLPVKVLPGHTGLIGWSLGGTTAAAALARHGAELGGVRWYASHESPYGEGIIDGEFGSRNRPNRFYDAATGKLDLSGLRYSADLPVRNMGRAAPGGAELRGGLFLDGNGNGRFDEETDFAFSGIFIPGPPPNVFYSPMLTRAARDGKLFQKGWPPHIANLEQAEACWRIRDGVSQIPAAVKNVPDLAVIVFAGEVDHVQGTADHRHILLQYGGFQEAGVRWIRLNPDVHYVEWVLGRKVPGVPQNDAGAPFGRGNIRRAVMPQPPAGPAAPQALTAAACELADRTHKREWRGRLDGVLYPEAPHPPRPPR